MLDTGFPKITGVPQVMANGMKVFVSPLLPYWGTQMGPMKLSPRVTVTDNFRKEMDKWLLDFFGPDHRSPQPVLIEIIKGRIPTLAMLPSLIGAKVPAHHGEEVLYVSQRIYQRLQQGLLP